MCNILRQKHYFKVNGDFFWSWKATGNNTGRSVMAIGNRATWQDVPRIHLSAAWIVLPNSLRMFV